MTNILLCQHGGSANHGCEALARTAVELIRDAVPDCALTLYSYDTASDKKYLSDIEGLALRGFTHKPGRYSAANILYHLKKRILGADALVPKMPITRELRTLIAQSDLVIAIGGDNYCYDRGVGYYALDRYIKDAGKRYILLGCSIEPADLKRGLADHLGLFDCITARESITHTALIRHEFIRSELLPDPAFLLDARPGPLPDGFVPGDTVGVNLSPLIMKSERIKGITLLNFEVMIRDILEHTDMQVALIPHVVWEDSDDRAACDLLYQKFKHTGRVVVVEDADARRLKGSISQLRFFVGARTHATISAYSSCVPTLVVGYSVKALGIATDLFGTQEHYVLPVQNLEQEDDLARAFRWMREHEEQIAAHLKSVMPGYAARARLTGSVIAAELVNQP